MEKELAQSDIPVKRKIPKTIRKYHFPKIWYGVRVNPFSQSDQIFPFILRLPLVKRRQKLKHMLDLHLGESSTVTFRLAAQWC